MEDTCTPECKAACKDLQEKVAKLTQQLNESKKKEQSRGQTIQESQKRISVLKKELQKAKEDHEKQLKELSRIERERTSLRKKLTKKSKDPEIHPNQKIENQRIQTLKTRINSLVDEFKSRKVHPEEIQPLVLEIDELDLEKAYCLHYLGFLYGKIEHYGKAEQCCLRSLRIRETLIPQSKDLAATYNNLGLIYCSTNNYCKAEDYYLRSLGIQETIIPGSATLAAVYNNLGLLYENIKDYSKSENYYTKSLKIKETINSPTVETTRNSLRLVLNSVINRS